MFGEYGGIVKQVIRRHRKNLAIVDKAGSSDLLP
jgi:hypothetical protein